MIFIHDVERAYLKLYPVLSGRGVKCKYYSQRSLDGQRHV